MLLFSKTFIHSITPSSIEFLLSINKELQGCFFEDWKKIEKKYIKKK